MPRLRQKALLFEVGLSDEGALVIIWNKEQLNLVLERMDPEEKFRFGSYVSAGVDIALAQMYGGPQ